MSTLLILVDFQHDYLSDLSTSPHPNSLVEAAGRVLKICRKEGIQVIHVRTTVSKETDNRMPHWKTSNTWRCVDGTHGHSPPSELAELEGELVIHKSGFDPFEDGQLRKLLSFDSHQRAIICGIHLHACVRAVISGIFSASLDVIVIDEAVGSNDPVNAAVCRRYFEERTVRFISETTLMETLKSKTKYSDLDEKIDLPKDLGTQKKWQEYSSDQRVQFVKDFSKKLLAEKELVSEMITQEIGKPIAFAETEVVKTAEMIEDIVRVYLESSLAVANERYTIRFAPIGTIAIITPFNNPLYIAVGKIIPAILYGNIAVWKPSPKASKVSRMILGFFESCGLPQGVITFVNGGKRTVTKLLKEPAIKGVTFTGSLQAGYAIQELCSRFHLPFQAELGGNNAAIVWEDANVTKAAERICAGAFEMAGQRCTANRRVIVHEKSADSFIKKLKYEMKRRVDSDPYDTKTRVGPVVSSQDKSRLLSEIDRATKYCEIYQDRNAKNKDKVENWVPPTLVICTDPSTEIFQEESFGPILVLLVVKDWKKAIESCNGVKQGLVAALFSLSNEIQKRFLEEADAGILKINDTTSDASIGAPFGGWKASGIGPPEHGKSDRDFYTRIQTIYT